MVGREMKRPAAFAFCWPGVNPDCSMAQNADRLSAPLSFPEILRLCFLSASSLLDRFCPCPSQDMGYALDSGRGEQGSASFYISRIDIHMVPRAPSHPTPAPTHTPRPVTNSSPSTTLKLWDVMNVDKRALFFLPEYTIPVIFLRL